MTFHISWYMFSYFTTFVARGQTISNRLMCWNHTAFVFYWGKARTPASEVSCYVCPLQLLINELTTEFLHDQVSTQLLTCQTAGCSWNKCAVILVPWQWLLRTCWQRYRNIDGVCLWLTNKEMTNSLGLYVGLWQQ